MVCNSIRKKPAGRPNAFKKFYKYLNMKKIIPVLLLKNGWLVQSKSLSTYQNLEILQPLLLELVSGVLMN